MQLIFSYPCGAGMYIRKIVVLKYKDIAYVCGSNLRYKSNIKEVVLTPEYNCRFISPVCVSGRVKILHGRHPELQTVAKEINSDINTRIFHPRWGLISDKKLQLITKVLTK